MNEVIGTVIVVSVMACCSFAYGIKEQRKRQREGQPNSLSQNEYFALGVAALMIALFFLIEDIHEPFSEPNLLLKIPLLVLQGLILSVGLISCLLAFINLTRTSMRKREGTKGEGIADLQRKHLTQKLLGGLALILVIIGLYLRFSSMHNPVGGVWISMGAILAIGVALPALNSRQRQLPLQARIADRRVLNVILITLTCIVLLLILASIALVIFSHH